MEKILIVFIHVFLLTLWLYNMFKLGRKILEKKKKNNYEHIEDVFEKALFDIAIILLFMYAAMMFFGVGVWSCTCLVVAIVVSAGIVNKKIGD